LGKLAVALSDVIEVVVEVDAWGLASVTDVADCKIFPSFKTGEGHILYQLYIYI